ncbi:MAG: IMP cyclohydrolase [Lachnospiraceae bacterium]|nr:IMP cyclohydrolase [Lachnospiraceae bacterium]
MLPIDLKEELSRTTYPGRGMITGISPDGKYAVCAYFIMGRSENSRNRVFVKDGAGIRTEAYDPSKVKDPSLIIYAPVRVLEEYTIISNGDQTDTIYDGLKNGLSFAASLKKREFEPDAPNYTPRISCLMKLKKNGMKYRMSIIKSADGDPSGTIRSTFVYEKPLKGEGRFLHTYMGDGSPLPSFEGEPTRVSIEDTTIDAFTETVWSSLNTENRVSLFTRFIDLKSQVYDTRIVNKNGGTI